MSTGSPLIGTVNNDDRVDYFRVTAQDGDYLFTTNGLQGRANIEIFDASRQSIASFNSNASYPTEKFFQAFNSGIYFIKITQSIADSAVGYTIAGQKQTDEVSNLLDTATSLTPTEASTNLQSNYVFKEGRDSTVDYYRLNLEKRGFLTVDLRNMFGNLDVHLQRVNSDGTLDTGRIFDSPSLSPTGTYGQGQEVFGGTLNPGEYILRVFAPEGSVGSTYDLFASLKERSDQPSITQDINFGGGSSAAKNLVEVDNFAFFAASDGQKNFLWRSDGTLDGTTKIREFASIGGAAISTGNAVYFLADDGTTGSELWRSDVSGNVNLVADIANGNSSINILQIVAAGDTVFFSATFGDQRKLFSTTGTGVTEITGINAATVSNMVAVDNGSNKALFFQAESPTRDIELWRVAPGQSSAVKIDLNENDSSDPSSMTFVGGSTMYLVANRGNGFRLVKLENIFSDNVGEITQTTIGNGVVSASDGFNGGEELVFVEGGTTVNGEPKDILYLTANVTSSGRELVKLVDPLAATGASTLELVANINTNPGQGSAPTELIAFGNKLYFTATETGAAGDRKLWYSDGNTVTAINMTGISDGYSPSSLTVVGSTLFLVANDGITGAEVWRTTGTTLTQVQDLFAGPESSSPQNLINIGGALFFVATNGVDGLEVWSVGEGDDIL
ncbi:hypothetical protein [Egbenema bharatensis]|uniref:hypothetical protein n=1 Tax=Egbenema bharatensis TaxID=3463334 RepID=UPI003A836764